MDFFDAARDVAGTDRWIQYKDGMKMRFIFVDLWTLELRDENNKKMPWPFNNWQKEKVWRVEPRPKKPKFFVKTAFNGDVWFVEGEKSIQICDVSELPPNKIFKLVPVKDLNDNNL